MGQVFYCQYVDLLLILIAAARSGITARRATSRRMTAMFSRRFTVARLWFFLRVFTTLFAKRALLRSAEGWFS